MSDRLETAGCPSHPQAGRRVEFFAEHRSGQVVVRETGKFYRGVFLVPRDQIVIARPVGGERA